MFEVSLLFFSAFAAGVLSTIAGGGTFFTFPALVYVGLPPVVANATSTLAVTPGYLGGVIGFRKEIAALDRRQLWILSFWALIGGVAGASLLLVSSDRAFSALVPFLLLAATLAFWFGEQARAWLTRHVRLRPYSPLSLIAVSIYGGYFQGGLGIVLLALISLWGLRDLTQMNALKNALSLVLGLVPVVVFALGGLIEVQPALLMMVGALLGGYAGAPLAKWLPKPVVHKFIVGVGLTLSAIFFWRTFL